MKIDLNYKHIGDKASQEITFDILTFAVNKKFENGIPAEDRKLWGKVQDKLEIAIEKKGKEIDLTDEEQTFTEECFMACDYPAPWSRDINILEEEVAKPKKEVKTAPEGK